MHGLGEPSELVDPLVCYEQLAKSPPARQRKWAGNVHAPLDEAKLASIRRSTASGLPYGEPAWVDRLSKRFDLDLTIRPRGRPRKDRGEQ